MKRNRFFTLIELIVVIVVLGILAAIVVPNISNWQKEAESTRNVADVRNLQTTVDSYTLKNDGDKPTTYPAELGKPAPVDFNKVKPKYLRNLPKGKDMKYWVDNNGTVWGSTIDSPKDVDFTTGTLSWTAVKDSDSYNIYATKPVSVTGSVSKTNKLHFVKSISDVSIKLPALPEGEDYLVSAVDRNGFETPPVTSLYKGYTVAVEPSPSEDSTVPTSPAIPNQTAPTEMQGYLVPEGTIATASSSYQSTPYLAIDGDINTYWVANDWEGTIELIFPSPEFIKGIQLAEGYYYPENVVHKIYGQQNGQWIEIGTTSQMVKSELTILSPVNVTQGNYTGLRIVIARGSSWPAIHGLTLLK